MPAASWLLPPILQEVSAAVAIDERTVVCLQDELGSLFVVDLAGEKPLREVPFGDRGDYEGLARVGEDFWVLRSDGMLLQLTPHGAGLQEAARHRLALPYDDYEGLCYDSSTGLLLVLPKSRGGQSKADRDRLQVYGVVPESGALLPAPVVAMRRSVLVAALEALNPALLQTPRAGRTGRTEPRLLASELLCVPGSEDLWLLFGVDHLLLRVDRTGQLRGAIALDPELLPQPEGLAVFADGRLLVASEGRGAAGRFALVAAP